jgi:hypothetical protein
MATISPASTEYPKIFTQQQLLGFFAAAYLIRLFADTQLSTTGLYTPNGEQRRYCLNCHRAMAERFKKSDY